MEKKGQMYCLTSNLSTREVEKKLSFGVSGQMAKPTW